MPPEELVSKNGYEELLLDLVALGNAKGIELPKPLGELREKISREQRLEKLADYNPPTYEIFETSGDISPEKIKEMESYFVQRLPQIISTDPAFFFWMKQEERLFMGLDPS